jgi:two-component system response regulator FixJ
MREAAVFVVDDDRAALKSLSRTIAAAGWRVEAFDSPEKFLDSYDPERPGCIVLDLRMPEISGLTVQKRLAERGSNAPIIFITGFADVSAAVSAMKGGAVDFLQKPFSSRQLLSRIEQANQEDAALRQARATRLEVEQRLEQLTPREEQVLELIVAGLLNKQIAAQLRIAQRTVEVHRSQIMKKMRAETGTHLVRMVLTAPAGADR